MSQFDYLKLVSDTFIDKLINNNVELKSFCELLETRVAERIKEKAKSKLEKKVCDKQEQKNLKMDGETPNPEDMNFGKNVRDGSRSGNDIAYIDQLSTIHPVNPHGGVFNKRYTVTIKWRDVFGKLHQKTIKFGDAGQNFYVDHKNIEWRDQYLNYHKPTDDPLKASFWTRNILNSDTADIDEAFMNIKKKLFERYNMKKPDNN